MEKSRGEAWEKARTVVKRGTHFKDRGYYKIGAGRIQNKGWLHAEFAWVLVRDDRP